MGIFPEGQANNPEQQAVYLASNVKKFTGCIRLLPKSLFLKKKDSWAPRDVIAHLIGWNIFSIEGCQQINRGETPAYLIDPGDDFSRINAMLVQKYNSTDKTELIKQLEDSTEKLERYISTIKSEAWETDYGVIYKENPITIKDFINGLIAEYDIHKQQIEKWVENG
ncbi:ClbS/DfsB family four-helix bundle protein [Chloroflexota bacterium]